MTAQQLEHDRYWSACGLYVAGMIKHSDTVTPVPLTLILRATDIRYSQHIMLLPRPR